MNTVINAEHLSKRYIINHQSTDKYLTFRDAMTNTAKRFGSRLRHPFSSAGIQPSQEEFWALKDISFELKAGERVGVIGRNGAGKSTLLKVLSRITEPSSGRISIEGRVASLLEVGTGFHPELTGRENVFLNGAILGMSRSEIARKFDEIIDFAEIEKFLDTPVKRYSSGMYVRLAFAVAAHLEPEVLIVDEVLAVGDAQFQKKCMGKMEDAGNSGRAILFVSHNMSAIRSLCTRALVLQRGVSVFQGDTDTAIARYLEIDGAQNTFEKSWDEIAKAPGNERIRVRRIRIVPPLGVRQHDIDVRTPFDIEIEYWNLKKDTNIDISFHVLTPEGGVVFASTTWLEKKWHGKNFPAGLFRSTCSVPGDLLNIGPYRINFYFAEQGTTTIYAMEDQFSFELRDSNFDRGSFHGKWPGVFRPILSWETNFLEEMRTP